MAYIVLNKTGCVERKGNIQLRLDMFLEPTDARYSETYVQVPDIPPDAIPPIDETALEAWINSFPLKWQLNPFHSHFIYTDSDVTKGEIEAKMAFHLPNFYKAWSEGRTIRSGWATETRIRPLRYDEVDEPDIYALRKAQCLERLKLLPDITTKPSIRGGRISPATSIDVGSAATDRGSSHSLYFLGGYDTAIDYNNPANDTGTIDTVEAWFSSASGGNSFKVGTFTDDGSDDFTCNDAELIGEVSAGSKQTSSGLDLDISSGEYMGCDARAASTLRIEKDTSGGSGVYSLTGQYCDPADSATFTLYSGDILSLYGTGETAAGNVQVIPSTLAITITPYAPTISLTDNKVVTPGELALTTTAYAPTISVSDNKVVTPSELALVLSTFAPIVTKEVTPRSVTISNFW